MKLKIIVVVNKIDVPASRSNWVLDKTLDLFFELGADEASADFPIIYASAKEGKAGLIDDLSSMTDITPVFEAILDKIPAPSGDPSGTLQILVTSLLTDTHKGKIAIGRIYNGKIKNGEDFVQITKDTVNKFKVTSLMTFEGLDKVEIEEVQAGDIVAVAGILDPKIGETISDVADPEALPRLSIEEPTIRVTISVNNSPFGGREGKFKTSWYIKERLYNELETDMALRVEENSTLRVNLSNDSGLALRSEATNGWVVSGRGELHLAILIERMRREGYEFSVAKPQVIDKEVNGEKLTPFEKVFIEVPEVYSGVVMQKLGARRGEIQDMKTENGMTIMEFIISTKALFGYRSEFVADTRGLGIMNTLFDRYAKDTGYSYKREQGSLVASESGTTNTYGLTNVQDRGALFLGPGVSVYKGQVVGKNSREEDIDVNVCKEKHQSNMRSKGEGVTRYLRTPITMGLEDALEYIGDDELVEVTPQSIRIRKVILDRAEEKRKKSQGII